MSNLDDFWPPSSVTTSRRGDSAQSEHSRRQKALSRHEIVQVAVALADAGGAVAVNMRQIAKELDVNPMSLYWHVADKEQLLNLMLDAIEGEAEPLPNSGDWRADFINIARQKRHLLLRHPWVANFISERSPLSPNALLQIERSLTVLDRFRLETRITLQILMALDNYVTGSVLNELREIRVGQSPTGEGLTPAKFSAAMRDWKDRLNQSGIFNHVVQIFDEGIDPDSPETRESRFEFGLKCVLDGIAIQLH
jgi:AcrR family transcriptional regulator